MLSFDWSRPHKILSKLLTNTERMSKAIYSEVTIPINTCALYKLESGPKKEVTLTRDQGLDMLHKMMVIRRLETTTGNLYKEKLIRGFCHLYSGQEAVAVGLDAVKTTDDAIITGYRCHGIAYIQGISILAILAEMLGKRIGCSKGKGGSMHLYNKKTNYYGGCGIVGAQVPIGTGIAFAMKYKGIKGVAVAAYGDGAANQGQVFEAFNMAALFKLPVIYLVENNGYSMGTSSERSTANTEYYTRGDYIPGVQADGMDLMVSREAFRFALEHCRTGKGPIVLEMKTYRYAGHSMSDPGTSYRTRDEVQAVRQNKDPIQKFTELLIKNNFISKEEYKQKELAIRKDIDEDLVKAKAAKDASIDSIATDIYVNPLKSNVRGTLPWKNYPTGYPETIT